MWSRPLPSARAAALALALVGCEATAPGAIAPTPEEVDEETILRGRTAPPSTLAEQAAQWPALRPRPRPLRVGARELHATRCHVRGGAERLAESVFRVAGDVARTDAGLVVIDPQGALRRYLIEAERPCALSPDLGFGDGGRLELPGAAESAPSLLAADDAGRLYAASESESWRIGPDGEIARCAVGAHSLAVGPEGAVHITTPDGRVLRLRYDEAGACRGGPWPAGSDLRARFAAHAAGHVWLTPRAPHADRVLTAFTAEGLRATLQLGKTGERDPIVRSRALVGDARGLALVDGHARRLRLFAKDGSRRGSVDLLRLLDLPLPWVGGATRVRERVSFFAIGHERGAASGLFEGLLFRVAGL